MTSAIDHQQANEANLPMLHALLEQRVSVLEQDMSEIRRDLGEFRGETQKELKSVNDSLKNVVTGALNSMPQWAAQSLRTHSMVVGGLGGLCCALVAVVIDLLTKH